MLPSGSCTDAIASIVSETCARLISPSTSGSSWSVKAALPPLRHRGRDLLAVEDDALAEDRVQRAFGDPGPARVLLDQHAEEVVVAADGRSLGVLEAERALQPPVRRVERVRVVRA